MSWMNADADDIEASISVVARRTDADPARIIVIGESAGGAASLALGARQIPGIGSVVGRTRWLLELDDFLRAHNLPIWPLSSVDVMLQKLQWPPSQRAFIQAYLAAPGEKAFARTPGRQNSSYRIAATLDDARKLALEACQQKGEPCVIAIENDRWTGAQ